MVKDKIFVVEDDKPLAHLIRLTLEREGFEVEVFHTAEEALKRLKKGLPDILLLDIMLPGMSGLDLLEILRSDTATSGVKTIMLTAKKELSDVQRALALGVEGYIAKPFEKEVLLEKIESALPEYYVDENVLAEIKNILEFKPVFNDVQELREHLANINCAMRTLRKGAIPERYKEIARTLLVKLAEKKKEVLDRLANE